MPIATTQNNAAGEGTSGLRWMEGRWVGRDGERRWEENWTRCGDALCGRSLEMEGSETTFREQLRIERCGDEIAYSATPEGVPVIYELVELSVASAIFENAAQDFPRRARYQRHGATLSLTLTGEQADGPVEVRIEWQLEAPAG